jgi:hypothetical protein
MITGLILTAEYYEKRIKKGLPIIVKDKIFVAAEAMPEERSAHP